MSVDATSYFLPERYNSGPFLGYLQKRCELNLSKDARILVVALRQIGDVLLTTPLIRSLRGGYPDATIDILVIKGRGGILEGNKDCNIVEIDERPSFLMLLGFLLKRFRKYDLSITTQVNDRSYLYMLFLGRVRVGLVPGAGYKGFWKKLVCHGFSVPDGDALHTIVDNLKLAELLCVKSCFTVIPPSCPDGVYENFLPESFVRDGYVVLHPFPMWKYKQWNGWSDLLKLLNVGNVNVVITGGGREEEVFLCDKFCVDFPGRVVSVAGKMNFQQLSNLLRRAMVVVAPDTVVAHLASACGAQTVALFGPSNAMKWGPWPANLKEVGTPWLKRSNEGIQRFANVVIMQSTLECVPCMREGCENHRFSVSKCLDLISAEAVFLEVKRCINLK